MDDPIIMADRALAELCANGNIKVDETMQRTFRAGFMAGCLHQLDKDITAASAELQAREQAA